MAIAGCEWECCFEWRGDAEDHEADHDINQSLIAEYRKAAEEVLTEALNIEGVNPRKVIREAERVCREREKDGWGASCTGCFRREQ